MSDTLDRIRKVLEAGSLEPKLRAEVLEWMRNEGNAGRFRTNANAPMWADYERARDDNEIAASFLSSTSLEYLELLSSVCNYLADEPHWSPEDLENDLRIYLAAAERHLDGES
jgi:hypothetical protein